MDSESPLGLTLWATDIEAMASFLQSICEFEVLERHPGFATVARGGAIIDIHADEDYRGHPWYDALQRDGAARGIGAEIRIRVEEVEAAYARALAAGAVALHGPYEQHPGALEAVIMGPEGYLFALWSPIPFA